MGLKVEKYYPQMCIFVCKTTTEFYILIIIIIRIKNESQPDVGPPIPTRLV